jgi:hypothetical protein
VEITETAASQFVEDPCTEGTENCNCCLRKLQLHSSACFFVRKIAKSMGGAHRDCGISIGGGSLHRGHRELQLLFEETATA